MSSAKRVGYYPSDLTPFEAWGGSTPSYAMAAAYPANLAEIRDCCGLARNPSGQRLVPMRRPESE
jgi:hypothetical protein